MFPQQFFPFFGVQPPQPFTAMPFFFEDGVRTYFVTEVFPGANDSVADSTAESPYFGRLSLTATSLPSSASVIFPPVSVAPEPGPTATPSAPAGNSAVAASQKPATALSQSPQTKIAAQPATSSFTPIAGPTTPPSQILFSTFWHPHVCPLIKALNRYGLSNLLTLNNQALTNDNGVISGAELYQTVWILAGTARPGINPGLLTAQSQLYEVYSDTYKSIPPAPNGTSYLYYNALNSSGQTGQGFYYDTQLPPNAAGDACLGSIIVVPTFPVVGVKTGPTVFEATYKPNENYVFPDTFPRENIDFSFNGAYSIYNWELFFHIPLLVATQLSQNQQFQDAQSWFHYIFNPTISSNDPTPQRYWRFLPFYECSPWDHVEGQIQNLFNPPSSGNPLPSLCGQDVNDQIAAWAANPFDPFLIGRMRPIAFRMKVVMAYLDNLIAWGDSLFGQNTRESINEATQIYVLAKDILGPRPAQIPQRGTIQDYTYNDLKTLFGLDSPSNPYLLFSNVVVQMENDFPYLAATSSSGASSGSVSR